MNKLILLLVIGIIITGCATKQIVDTPQINEAELGKQAFDREDYQGAVEYYGQWLEKYSNDASVLMDRGRAYRQLKKFSEALEDFDKASAINTKDLTPKVYQALMMVALNRMKEGRAAIDMIMANPTFGKIGPYEKFMTYYTDGQLKNAEESYDKAILSLDEAIKIYELYPHVFRNYKSTNVDRFAVYHKSVAYANINDYPKAAEEMYKYIEMSKQRGTEVTSKDYKSLALALYLSDNLAKCKAVLPHISPEDRKSLADTLSDSMFTEQH